MNTPRKTLALLIDGDNIPLKYLEQIVEFCRIYGEMTIARAYGDWNQPPLSSQLQLLKTFGIEKIQQNRLGKNATDFGLAMDVAVMLERGGTDIYFIASSDGHFASVCEKIQQKSANVVVIGSINSISDLLIHRCNQFFALEDIVKLQSGAIKKPVVKAVTPVKRKATTQSVTSAKPKAATKPAAPVKLKATSPTVTAQKSKATAQPSTPAKPPQPAPSGKPKATAQASVSAKPKATPASTKPKVATKPASPVKPKATSPTATVQKPKATAQSPAPAKLKVTPQPKPPAQSKVAVQPSTLPKPKISTVLNTLVQAHKEITQTDGWALLAQLGEAVREIEKQRYGEVFAGKRLSTWIKSFPDKFEIKDDRVRIR